MTSQPAGGCIRRWYAVAPSCSCPTCRTQRLKAAKLRRVTGQGSYRYSDQAYAALDRMLAAGRTISEIAATAGIDRGGLSMTLTSRRQGRPDSIGYIRATRIISAEAKPPAGGRVEATGTRRRLQALNVLGHPLAEIEQVTGVKVTTLRAIRDGVVQVTDATYVDAVAKAYAQLEHVAGRSAQTRRHALTRRWAPPAAWDDIDDRSERPKGLARVA